MSTLKTFAAAVSERPEVKQTFGWIETLLPILLPVLVEAISQCFQSKSQLEAFAADPSDALKVAGLKIRCNRAVREAGVSGPVRVARAGRVIQEGILAQLREEMARPRSDGTDPFQDAWDEATSVV